MFTFILNLHFSRIICAYITIDFFLHKLKVRGIIFQVSSNELSWSLQILVYSWRKSVLEKSILEKQFLSILIVLIQFTSSHLLVPTELLFKNCIIFQVLQERNFFFLFCLTSFALYCASPKSFFSGGMVTIIALAVQCLAVQCLKIAVYIYLCGPVLYCVQWEGQSCSNDSIIAGTKSLSLIQTTNMVPSLVNAAL